MAYWIARQSRPVILLAVAGMSLAACSTVTPTAPSSRLASEAASGPADASVSAAPVGTPAAASAANTIKITRGTLALASGLPGTVTLQGSHGFRFDGRTLSGVEPSLYCGSFNPCAPGATVPFRATWLGTDLPGTVRVQGDEYPVGGLDGPSMAIELTGSFVAPAHLSDSAVVTVPFAGSGVLVPSGFQLAGRGQVTLKLQWQPFIDGWAITYASFDFSHGRSSEG